MNAKVVKQTTKRESEFNKNTEKMYKSKVLVMEVFHYDGEEQHSPVIAVLEKYNKKDLH